MAGAEGELVLFEREGSENGKSWKLEVAGLGVISGDAGIGELLISEIRVSVTAASALDKPITTRIKLVDQPALLHKLACARAFPSLERTYPTR